jgi:hypothetical protein
MIPEKIAEVLKSLVLQPVCRANITSPMSLNLGFGNKVFHGKKHLANAYYGEWEVGTYYCSWRILRNGAMLLASNDPSKVISDLNAELGRVDFGVLERIDQFSEYDVRIHFSSGIDVEILATMRGDEIFHVFCPNKDYVEFSNPKGWLLTKSDVPFSREGDRN